MAAFLTENFWLWLLIGGLFVAAGFVLYSAWGKWRPFAALAALGLTVIAVGAAVVFFLPNDRKTIRRTVERLAEAVENNDIEQVVSLIDSTAGKTVAKAVHHLGLAKIDRAAVNQLQIKSVNYYTSPPTAVVAFNGSVSGHEKMFGTLFSITVHFDEVELVKNAAGEWKVTDRCFFRYPGYDGR